MEGRLHIAAHPLRLRILRELEGEEPLYVNQIVERLRGKGVDVDRKIVSYHLSRLLECGLVRGEMKMANLEGRIVAVKYFYLTEDARSILARLKWL